MPSFHATHVNGPDFSLKLERMWAYMTMAVLSISYLTIFLNDLIVMAITLGVPYLQFRLYRYDGESSTEIQWVEIMKSLVTLWDQYCYLPLHVLPLLFPMISSSGLTPCSTASFVAIMTLITGVISVATSSTYKLNAKVLHNQRTIAEWLKASQPTWREIPNKSFWVFISLPNLIFFLSVGLFISTVMLTVWERSVVSMTPSLEIQGCSMKRFQTFKAISLVILVPIVAHFAFIFTKMRSIAALRTAEVATVVLPSHT